jgi:hypothetical protein
MNYSKIGGAWPDPTKQEIHLECPPGDPRPADLLPDVIRDTGLPLRESVSRLSGHWAWDYTDIPRELWEAAVPVIEIRIAKLYRKKVIRAGQCGGFTTEESLGL